MVDYTGKNKHETAVIMAAGPAESIPAEPDNFVLMLLAADIAFNGWTKYQSVTGRTDSHKAKAHVQKIAELANFIRTTLAEIG